MIGKRIVGTWELVSWTYQDENGSQIHYLGENPRGILHYSSANKMGVQIMKPNRRKFANGTLMDGTSEEINSAYKSYFAYFGAYTEVESGKLVHQIEGSNFPNWTGESEVRYAAINGAELTLSAPSILPDGTEVLFEVKWKRLDSPETSKQ